ncbi:hypothetical protein H310_03183 [Aphanomyces invadans]|uniref:Uncharacterized protein n=1 Tax=Aphanomyces invadans TaxID=157072 RepID=A0A024UHV4_9STRA|nr:hypothetical protein H310_03183 [Aphanomyces invadans]ETW05417.1 hypothetical protein H310_03183 [Aphanomyces invadans]|eukprot:XP_008865194.1 hypothetical protein H310_03183 [Aphanomyces invadans]
MSWNSVSVAFIASRDGSATPIVTSTNAVELMSTSRACRVTLSRWTDADLTGDSDDATAVAKSYSPPDRLVVLAPWISTTATTENLISAAIVGTNVVTATDVFTPFVGTGSAACSGVSGYAAGRHDNTHRLGWLNAWLHWSYTGW